MSDTVVGIDLGTTNSCLCVYLRSNLKILESKEGGRTIPSYLFFTDQGGVIVGQYAKRMADAKPEYGVYEVKRLVGRKFDDPSLVNILQYLPFNVKNVSNEPVVVIENKNQVIKKSAQDLCCMILEKIKADAEAKLGFRVTKAVITVPAYFNVSQREATLAAAQQAGFTVLKLLNEPTAAALSYYNANLGCSEEGSYSLVYDLGGGTFDVAILRKDGFNINIIAVDGDTHLGGHDLDNLLVEHVCQSLIKEYNYDPKKDRRNMRRLKNECEEAKKLLSVSEDVTIILTAFVPNNSVVEITITRTEFYKMASPIFIRTIEIMRGCLDKAALSKSDISEVILSGGSSRIPKIQDMITNFFDGKNLNRFVNPDECVAEGAALQAAMLSQDPLQQITQMQVTDVTALSLGISNFVDVMSFMITRNTPIPASNTIKRITVYNKQTNMSFDIYEGERVYAKKNHFLGVLEISGLTPAPPGLCTVAVTMTIDQNGILTVSAQETVSNKTKDVKIVYARGSRSDSEINNVVVDARVNEAEDKRFSKFAETKGYLLKYCVRVMYNLESKKLIDSYRHIYERCDNVGKHLKALQMEDEVKVNTLQKEIIELCLPIVKKYSFINMP